MGGYLMALVVGASDNVGPLGHLVNGSIAVAADDEEGCSDVISGQNVQNLGSVYIWTVVKRESNIAISYTIGDDASVWYRTNLWPRDVYSGSVTARDRSWWAGWTCSRALGRWRLG